MDTIQSVALAAGLAWGSGLRLYAVLFAAGLLGRLGYLELPQTLQVLEHPWVIGASGAMLLVEFLADKIPVVDPFWDAVHSFIRIPAGAILAALALGNYDPTIGVVAAILGGTLTASVHAAKAGGRALINVSPEPFSNIVASFGEEAVLIAGLYAAFAHPAVFLVLLLLFLTLLVWLLPRLWRGVRKLAVSG
ncbi:DUF4126 domain-containing protein [Propionivibrio sp.]|uniref:DUF4126 domain-containing protein n=1 Tax=Propionivibrio sp. TaxID=2212460 RepID=UPI0025F6AA91|nr:DUF4126 domain-containing protein [Propionivibrio sp.]MBK7356623.1 DUF4126 domain-containing protein [Propionivibrio sp.]